MGMRAGSYNAAAPQWRGVIRDGSYPAYVCVHTNHGTQPDPSHQVADSSANLTANFAANPATSVAADLTAGVPARLVAGVVGGR